MLTFLILVYDLRKKFQQHTHTHAVLLCHNIKAHFNFNKLLFGCQGLQYVCVCFLTTTYLRTWAGQTYLYNNLYIEFFHLKQI